MEPPLTPDYDYLEKANPFIEDLVECCVTGDWYPKVIMYHDTLASKYFHPLEIDNYLDTLGLDDDERVKLRGYFVKFGNA